MESLGFEESQIVHLHRITLGSSPKFQRCGQSSETVLHAIVQCPNYLDLWISTARVLSQQSAESIKIVSLKEEEKSCFLAAIAIVKKVI